MEKGCRQIPLSPCHSTGAWADEIINLLTAESVEKKSNQKQNFPRQTVFTVTLQSKVIHKKKKIVRSIIFSILRKQS
jgi:hypothetical protein